MSNNYPPANFAKEAVKKIRAVQVDYCNKGLDNNLLDSELEEIINNSFQQTICDNCETRILFDANERALIDLFKTIILCRKAKNSQEIDNLTSEVILKYPNLRQFI